MIPDLQRLLPGEERIGKVWTKQDGRYDYAQFEVSELFGTPGYMPPEQELDGIVSPVSDVYSLGVTIDRLFFDDGRVRMAPMQGHISAKIQALVSQMCRPDPSERLQSMHQVENAIRSVKLSLG